MLIPKIYLSIVISENMSDEYGKSHAITITTTNNSNYNSNDNSYQSM